MRVVPRMVPPRGRIPEISRAPSGCELALDQPAPALANAHDLVAGGQAAARHGSDHRVQPGAVAPAGENRYPRIAPYHRQCEAEVAELADAPDSKSGGLRAVWVRFPPSAWSTTRRFTLATRTPCADTSSPAEGLIRRAANGGRPRTATRRRSTVEGTKVYLAVARLPSPRWRLLRRAAVAMTTKSPAEAATRPRRAEAAATSPRFLPRRAARSSTRAKATRTS